ncbi:LORF2 protein, partial [Crocuta crocuta]
KGCRERKTLLHHQWKCKLVQPLWKTVWRFLKKLKVELPYHPAISLLGIYPKETKITDLKGYIYPDVYSNISKIAKLWKEPKCPLTDEWREDTWYTYTIEYYSAIKKNEILPFATMWMELESIMLSEINQSEKDKHHMSSLVCEI